MLRFVIAGVDNFESAGISTNEERKSTDSTKCVIHIEKLTDDQFDNVRFDENFIFKSGEALESILNTSEWKSQDI